MSSKGIEPFTVINQFFYRESPLPIGSPALLGITFILYNFFLTLLFIFIFLFLIIILVIVIVLILVIVIIIIIFIVKVKTN
jgi:hypothetical protein